MQGLLALLLLIFMLPASSQAPPLPNSFRYGADYQFEKLHATRSLWDQYDRGPINLAVYVWKPLQPRTDRLVLFSHGSTGGGSINPREPAEYIPRPLIRYFVTRGYTVVMPMRRGLGESGGTYVAECEYQAGKCSLQDYRLIAKPGLDDAMLDTDAVLDQVVFGKLVPRGTRIMLAGVSRGGFLSLRVAAERPDTTAGVINFVGGWISLSDAWPVRELEARARWHNDLLREYGAKTGAPTLWIYASGDPFYPEKVTRGFLDAFEAGGGTGQYVYVAEHKLPSGHLIAQAPDLWAPHADAFLQVVATGQLQPAK